MALRIKPNVDLKELEKFGLRPLYDELTGEINGFYTTSLNYTSIKKKVKGRFTSIFKYRGTNYYEIEPGIDRELLYDLIKADLVEKVEDKGE